MNGIKFICPDNDVLVINSGNEECVMETLGYTWTALAGKKIRVFSLRESYENGDRKGGPEDPLKFYVQWRKGEKEQPFFAKDVNFNGWAGSSFNVADHLVALGVKNVSLAIFVKDGRDLKKFHDYCKEKGIKFIPLGASNTGRTYVFSDNSNNDSVVCMEKPAEIDCSHNREKLNKKWDVIISSSTPDDIDVLKMNIELFQQNPTAIKTLMPSLSLINSDDFRVKDLFHELIKLTDVFQVNDSEASKYLSLNKEEGNQKPIERRKLVLELVKQLKVPVVIVTMGKWGAAVIATRLDVPDDEKYIDHPALRKKWKIHSTVGSGDAFHAGFVRIYMQAENNHHRPSLHLAVNIASEIAIRNAGVYGGNMSQDESKRLLPKEFMAIVEKYRQMIV
jgi:sugar/nucleoside kinase (ribokinase family)